MKLRTADDVARLEFAAGNGGVERDHNERDQKQFKMQAVSQATMDTDAANLKNAKAQVTQQQAIIDKKILRAPFAGHLGIRAVDLRPVSRAGTVIVTLQALDPIYVDFYVPQQSVDQMRLGQEVAVKVDAYKEQTFTGKISAINPKVDIGNRNVQMRAMLKNADHKLLPGMYATVDIPSVRRETYVTLPQTAITYNPYGDTVYVVENKGNGRRQAATGRTADFHHHRADARRPGGRAQRRRRGRHRSSLPARSSCTTVRS